MVNAGSGVRESLRIKRQSPTSPILDEKAMQKRPRHAEAFLRNHSFRQSDDLVAGFIFPLAGCDLLFQQVAQGRFRWHIRSRVVTPTLRRFIQGFM